MRQLFVTRPVTAEQPIYQQLSVEAIKITQAWFRIQATIQPSPAPYPRQVMFRNGPHLPTGAT